MDQACVQCGICNDLYSFTNWYLDFNLAIKVDDILELLLGVLMFWIVMACVLFEGNDTIQQPEVADPEWYGDIEPFVAKNCTTCHHDEGASPFSFEQLSDVVPLASVMLTSMQGGSMPPWMPDKECNDFQNERSVSQAEINRFQQWIELGSPEGDPALGVTEITEIEDIEASHSASLDVGFVPDVTQADQYRCFILDMDFEEETFIVETQVKPGSNQVHHVLVYALDPIFSGDILEADGQDGKQGYTCFGAPFPIGGDVDYSQGFPTQIGAWVPGLTPAVFAEGAALRVKANSVIVMQVHYSALGGDTTEDKTSYHIKTSSTVPDFIARTSPLAVQELDIPAGAVDVNFSDRFTNYYDFPLDIRSIAGHMHMLGKQEKADLLKEDGTQECLLDIPEWDFSWQQSYFPVEQILLQPGESIEVTCNYDNSSSNQPIVDGEQIEPSDVSWGDGSLDEMCLLYTTFLVPYYPLKPEEEDVCYGTEHCFQDCEGGLNCLMACDGVEFGCLNCALQEFLGCGVSDCAVEGLMVQDCMYECYSKSIMLGSPIGSCLEYECPEEYKNLTDCANPVMAGQCAPSLLENCGVSFN